MLTLSGCRERQSRLLEEMAANQYEAFLTANYRTVYYLTGLLAPAETPVIFLLRADGSSVLLSPVKGDAAASESIEIPTYSIDRSIDAPFEDAGALLRDVWWRKPAAGRCALERATMPAIFESRLESAAIFDATALIRRLRKRKHEDEIVEIRASLECCAAAYRAAREIIAPGRTELDVYSVMYAAVIEQAGTSIAFPGDFACGTRAIRGGGPPTRRKIERGDLYILDLFPAPALYFGDVCRTFAAGPPSELQCRAWEAVIRAMRVGEKLIRPGVRARDVYRAVKAELDRWSPSENSFWHHAGHGIGHHGHEAPRIIPGSDDVFEIGDVITLEPGVYTESLQGGIRLENNYVVREDRLENLFDFPSVSTNDFFGQGRIHHGRGSRDWPRVCA